MALRNTTSSYGGMAKSLHWIISLAVIGLLIAGAIMTNLEDSPTKFTIYSVHKFTGLTVLSLMVIRIVWTSMNPKPLLPPGSKRWEKIAEHAVHYSFYLLLILMPVSGWIMSTAAGYNPHFFGLELPAPGIAESEPVAEFFGWVHFVTAWTLFGLLLLHVGAALQHHFIKKDNILKRMLPGD